MAAPIAEDRRIAEDVTRDFDAYVQRHQQKELLRLILREQREKFLPLRVIKDRLDSGEIEPPDPTPSKGAAEPERPSPAVVAKHPSTGRIARPMQPDVTSADEPSRESSTTFCRKRGYCSKRSATRSRNWASVMPGRMDHTPTIIIRLASVSMRSQAVSTLDMRSLLGPMRLLGSLLAGPKLGGPSTDCHQVDAPDSAWRTP